MSASPEHEEFDPYRIWLGIPKSEQPPTYYRLLGVTEFESDPLVIQEGADRQSAHLRSKQIGQRMAASQKLLAEVAAAMGCLLNAENKAKYDRQLRARQQAELAAAEASSTPVMEASFPVAHTIPLGPPVPLPPPPVFAQPEPPAPYYEPPAPYYEPPAPYEPPQQPVIQTSKKRNTKKPQPSEGKLDPQTLKLIGIGAGAVAALFALVLVGGAIYWMSRKPAVIVQQPEPPVVQPSPGENPFEQNVRPADTSPPRKPIPPPNVVTTTNPIKAVPQRPRPASLVPPARTILNPQTVTNSAAAVKDGVEYLGALTAHLEVAYLNSPNFQSAEKHAQLWRNVLANPSATPVGPVPQNSAAMPGYKDQLLEAARQIDRRAQVDTETHQQVFPEVPGGLLVRLCVPTREAAAEPQGTLVRINGQDQFDGRLNGYINQLASHAKASEDNRELHDRLLYQAAIAAAIRYGYQRGYIEQLIACQLLEYRTGELISFAPQQSSQVVLRRAMDEVLIGGGLTKSGEDIGIDPRKQFSDVSTGPNTTYTWQPNGRWLRQLGSSSASYFETQRTRTTIFLQPVEQPGQVVTLTLDWCELKNSASGVWQLSPPGFKFGQWDIVRSDRPVIGQIRVPFPDQMKGSTIQFIPSTTRPLIAQSTTSNGSSVPPDANLRFTPTGGPTPGISVSSNSSSRYRAVPGSRVHIYRGTWLTGVVLANEGYLYRVHYDNYDASYDEAVVKGRLRLMMGPDGNPLVATNSIVQPPPGTTTSGSPSTTGVSNPDPKRRLWSHAKGYFAMNKDGTWNELAPTGNYYTLSLKSVTDEYVELQREGTSGYNRIKLYQKHMESTRSSTSQRVGEWITPLEEIEIDPEKQALLKKTVDQYAEALAKARENMLERFQAAMNSSRTGRAEERLAYISTLESERDRFKNHGLVPFSQPMRQATVDYISAINRARSQAEPVFDKAISYFLNNQQAEVAYGVRVLRQRTLAPILLMKLASLESGRASALNRGASVMQREDRDLFWGEDTPNATRLWSAGILNIAGSDGRWTADNSDVEMTSPREKNVTVKDKLIFNDYGTEFAAVSQQVPFRANSPQQKYNGGMVNTLESYEVRPTIGFVPKGTPMPAAEVTAPAETPAPEKPAEPEAAPAESPK